MFTWSRSDAACAEIRRLDLVLLQYVLGKVALVLLATGAMFACSVLFLDTLIFNFQIVPSPYREAVYIFVVFLIIFPRIFVLYFLWSNILIF